MDSLSTGSSQRGDTFNATLASPLIWRNRIVAHQGAHVTGHVSQVVSPGWFKRPAVITLSLSAAQGRSSSFPVQTGDLGPTQRFIHTIEILTQNASLGITAVLLLRSKQVRSGADLPVAAPAHG